MSEQPPKRYTLDTRGAAAYLGLPLRTLQHLVATRQIEHLATQGEQRTRRDRRGGVQVYRLSGRLRFSTDDLDAWVERKRVRVEERVPRPSYTGPIRHAPEPDGVREPLVMPVRRRFA